MSSIRFLISGSLMSLMLNVLYLFNFELKRLASHTNACSKKKN